MCIGLRVKYPHYSCQILMKLGIFSADFYKITQISNFMKIRPVGTELLHADRQTNGKTERHEEANSCFSQFCERALDNSIPDNKNDLKFFKKKIATAYLRFVY